MVIFHFGFVVSECMFGQQMTGKKVGYTQMNVLFDKDWTYVAHCLTNTSL